MRQREVEGVGCGRRSRWTEVEEGKGGEDADTAAGESVRGRYGRDVDGSAEAGAGEVRERREGREGLRARASSRRSKCCGLARMGSESLECECESVGRAAGMTGGRGGRGGGSSCSGVLERGKPRSGALGVVGVVRSTEVTESLRGRGRSARRRLPIRVRGAGGGSKTSSVVSSLGTTVDFQSIRSHLHTTNRSKNVLPRGAYHTHQLGTRCL